MQKFLWGLVILFLVGCGKQGEDSKQKNNWSGPRSDYYLDRGMSFGYSKPILKQIEDETQCRNHHTKFWRYQFINQLKEPFNHYPFYTNISGHDIITLEHTPPSFPIFAWKRDLLSHGHSFSDGIKLTTSVILQGKLYRWVKENDQDYIFVFDIDKAGGLVFDQKVSFSTEISLLGFQVQNNQVLVFTETSDGYQIRQLAGNSKDELAIIYQSSHQIIDVLFEAEKLFVLERIEARLPQSLIKNPSIDSPYSVVFEEYNYFNLLKRKILDGMYDEFIPEVENCTQIYFNQHLGNFSNGIVHLKKLDLNQASPAVEKEFLVQGAELTMDLSEGKIILAERVFDEAVAYFQVHLVNEDFQRSKSIGGEGHIPLDHFTFINEEDLFVYSFMSCRDSFINHTPISPSKDIDTYDLSYPGRSLRPLLFNKQIYLFKYQGYQKYWATLEKYTFNQGQMNKVDEVKTNSIYTSIGRFENELVLVNRSDKNLALSIYEEIDHSHLILKYDILLEEIQLEDGRLDTQVNYMSENILVVSLHKEDKEEIFLFKKNSSSSEFELLISWQQPNQKWTVNQNNCPFYDCYSAVSEHKNYHPLNSIMIKESKLYFSTVEEIRTVDLISGDRETIRFEDL